MRTRQMENRETSLRKVPTGQIVLQYYRPFFTVMTTITARYNSTTIVTE